MINFEQLEAKVAALGAVIANIKKDYADMLALIADLQSVVLGTEIQAKIDAITAQIDLRLAELNEADGSFPKPV